MTSVIEVRNVSRRFRQVVALDDVSFALPANTITGLLGRNGAGKTTVMKILTGQQFASSGSVRIFGESPVENDKVLRRMSFVKESQIYPDMAISHVLKAASWFYPDWDAEFAARLVDDFELPLRRRMKKVSRGMHSAVGIIIGLASRAEVTLFDEPYLGLDAVARQIFYDRLLEDYSENPRTVVLSTHLINEVANLLEHVVVIDKGRIVIDRSAEDVRGSAITVSGRVNNVEEFVRGRDVLSRETLGSMASATVAGELGSGDRNLLRHLELDTAPVSLQDYIVRSTLPRAEESAAPRSRKEKSA